ncbi:hypothetical protein STAQ_19880 [Allostella sp. ATCC 35155]|nr:hypothetical protein STAQ_19880 [Stella sp. ATCC 35155]
MRQASPQALARILAADVSRSADVQASVAQAATGCRLDPSAAARLGQAVEEVFVFVATRAPGSSFAIEVRDRHWRVEARLRCRLPAADLHWFNVTQPIDVADPDALEALGLLLASRLVGRLSVALEPDGGVVLSLEQIRSYAMPGEALGGETLPGGDSRPERADAAAIAGLAALFRRRFGMAVPRPFVANALAQDMAGAGDLAALVLRDGGGWVRAGIAWTMRSPRLAEVLGPVVADDDPATAAVLVEATLAALRGTGVTMIFAEERGPAFPEVEFDCLGRLGSRPLHFRVVAEDGGALSWADPVTRPFLSVFYEALALDRGVRDAPEPEGERPARGLLAVEIDRVASRVTLRPLLDGADLVALIERHVERFADEGLDDFRFETDHGVPWQGRLGPDLMRAGFFPRVVLPHGGLGDVIVWERDWLPG